MTLIHCNCVILFGICCEQAHLARCHPTESAELDAIEKQKAKSERKSMQTAGLSPTSSVGKSMKNQTLQECIRRRVVKWSVDSQEHKDRLTGVVNMLINTGGYFNVLC